MKIIYKQNRLAKVQTGLNHFGITDCYIKKLLLLEDNRSITKKEHHHTGFELHIVTEGYQIYEIDGTMGRLEKGSFLLIYPNIPHKLIESDAGMEKYSITFQFQNDAATDYFLGKTSARMSDNINFIIGEAGLKKEISAILIENCILEIIISVLRLSGFKEKEQVRTLEENTVLELAKSYIEDNIEQDPAVGTVAEYCHLSAKQLTRIFNSEEQMAPGEYITKRRVKRIESLLTENELSLKEISERMNFSSEYYFNAFFKKHAGMPPGEFRKMYGK